MTLEEDKDNKEESRKKLKYPIIQFSIIEASGIVLFHKGYVEKLMDEVLFSGFSAAIIVFARELGTKLNHMAMENINFYFKDCKDYFVVMGFHPKVLSNDIEEIINKIYIDLREIELSALIKKGVFHITEEYQALFLQRIKELQLKYQ